MRFLTSLQALMGVSVCFSAFLQPAADGQTAALAFESVSIKLHQESAQVRLPDCSDDHFSSAVPFAILLRWAYPTPGFKGLEFGQGMPESLSLGNFEIEANADHALTESECRQMVQALLAEKFKLAVHWETRTADIGELVVAAGGSKMQMALASDEGTDVNVVLDGRPYRASAGLFYRASKGLTLEDLAQVLVVAADPGLLTQIVDKTGLEGRYKIDFRFSDHMGLWDPMVDAALREQLGLRLEKHQGSVKVPVLDHVEPPGL